MHLQKIFRQTLLSYLATNLPGLAIISCCETAAILWEVSNLTWKLTGYYKYNYQYQREILAIAQVTCARQA